MQSTDLYSSAHLIVAAMRILEQRNAVPPSIDEVCKTVLFSLEYGNLICRKLHKIGIIDIVESAHGTKVFITDHLKIEEISRDKKENRLEEELKKFQTDKDKFTQKIESFQAEQAKKKKDLFTELDKKLKKGSDNK